LPDHLAAKQPGQEGQDVDIGISSTPPDVGPSHPPSTIHESLPRRLIRGIAWAWSARPSAMASATPEEARLRDLVEIAKLRIRDLEDRIFALAHDVRSLGVRVHCRLSWMCVG
jgi:hypothetical protein